jgi:hypothetical protein
MNELKAGVIVTPHDEGMCFDRGSDVMAVTERETKFYLKSEVDKVIAEKDAEIAELKERHKEEVDELQKATDSAWGKVNAMYDEILNHKYKRCLAMAAKYLWKRNYWRDSIPAYERQHQWENMAYKHYKHWLELAEKFKEEK